MTLTSDPLAVCQLCLNDTHLPSKRVNLPHLHIVWETAHWQHLHTKVTTTTDIMTGTSPKKIGSILLQTLICFYSKSEIWLSYLHFLMYRMFFKTPTTKYTNYVCNYRTKQNIYVFQGCFNTHDPITHFCPHTCRLEQNMNASQRCCKIPTPYKSSVARFHKCCTPTTKYPTLAPTL